MLPKPKDRPPCRRQSLVGVSVSRDIPSHLGGPELSIALGYGVVLWTAMPKAPVDEHGDPRPAEYEVRPAIQFW